MIPLASWRRSFGRYAIRLSVEASELSGRCPVNQHDVARLTACASSLQDAAQATSWQHDYNTERSSTAEHIGPGQLFCKSQHDALPQNLFLPSALRRSTSESAAALASRRLHVQHGQHRNVHSSAGAQFRGPPGGSGDRPPSHEGHPHAQRPGNRFRQAVRHSSSDDGSDVQDGYSSPAGPPARHPSDVAPSERWPEGGQHRQNGPDRPQQQMGYARSGHPRPDAPRWQPNGSGGQEYPPRQYPPPRHQQPTGPPHRQSDWWQPPPPPRQGPLNGGIRVSYQDRLGKGLFTGYSGFSGRCQQLGELPLSPEGYRSCVACRYTAAKGSTRQGTPAG